MNIYPTGFEDLYQSHPLTLVDVGASGGISSLWASHRRYLRVIGFEPDIRAYKTLKNQQNRSMRFFNIGLHRQQGDFSFYSTRSQECSSLLMPNRQLLDRFHNSQRLEIVQKMKIKCRSLDEVLSEAALTDVDFIKLDTQGSELAILEGATKILADSVFGLEIEVYFAELYKDQPLFADVDPFVRQRGFDLIDICTTSWKHSIDMSLGFAKGRVMWADTLYFRSPQKMREILKNMDDRLAFSKLLHALSVCQLYGFFDYAIELLDIAASDLIDREDISNLKGHIRSQTPIVSRIPNFPGRKQIANSLLKMSKWLAPKRHSFKQPPPGNL
jgi:FkbM family methyltransferase